MFVTVNVRNESGDDWIAFEKNRYGESLIPKGDYVDLGSYLDFVKDHKASKHISIGFDIHERSRQDRYQFWKTHRPARLETSSDP